MSTDIVKIENDFDELKGDIENGLGVIFEHIESLMTKVEELENELDESETELEEQADPQVRDKAYATIGDFACVVQRGAFHIRQNKTELSFTPEELKAILTCLKQADPLFHEAATKG